MARAKNARPAARGGLRVADRMTPHPATIRSDALVWGAIEMMKTRRIRHLPVVDGEDRLVGIVTDRDLRQVVFDPRVQDRLRNDGGALRDLAVRDVMTWGVVTVRPQTDMRQVARLMYERKLGALPVVDGDRVVGIITEADVLATLGELLGREALDLHGPPLFGPRDRPTRPRPLRRAPARNAAPGNNGRANPWRDEGMGD